MGYSPLDRRSPLDPIAATVLGDADDLIGVVEARTQRAYPGARVVVWEGDAATFQFTYVSRSAKAIFGYPVERWTSEPSFWADHIVLTEDRKEAVAYCALATAGRRDHAFEYRARSESGAILVIRDMVRVIVGKKGVAERLRGLMFDVTSERSLPLGPEDLRARQIPSWAELESLAR